MLSAHSISAPPGQAAKYHFGGDYYTKDKDEPVAWDGSGAARLGLSEGKSSAGPGGGASVDPKQFEALLRGELPEGHEAAWKKTETPDKPHHPGWDFTLSAPKSVSVVAVLGMDYRVVNAHREAVSEAVGFMERYAFTRVRLKGGAVEYRNTENAVVSSATEFWSREQEAQLHTHNVFLNMTHDKKDDTWRSLHSPSLYGAGRAMGQVYQNGLANRLQALGYNIKWDRKKGTVEIIGVPEKLIDANSTRSKQIDAYVEEHSLEGRKGRGKAALATRKNKVKATHQELLSKALDKHEAEMDGLRELIEEAQDREYSRPPRDAREKQENPAKSKALRAGLQYGLQNASASEAVVEEAKIISDTLQIGGPEIELADIDAALKRYEDKKQIIRSTEQTGGKHIYRGRILSKDLVAEQKFAQTLSLGKGKLAPIHRKSVADRRVGAYRVRVNEGDKVREYPLEQEQHDAVTGFLTSRNRFYFINGVAGAGKSAAIGAVVQATRFRDHIAIAKTAQAAGKVADDHGIPGMTLDKFLQNGASDIKRGGIVFVDEATMKSTRAAKRLNELAAKQHFRVLAIGDPPKQLGAIEQGKPHDLAGRLGGEVSKLVQSRRHKTETVKAAVEAARAGEIKAAMANIDRVHVRGMKDIVDAAAHAWITSEDRESTRLMALDNPTRVALSNRVRIHLKEEGVLEDKGEELKIHSSRPMNNAQKKIAELYPEKNAAVTFHQGAKTLGIERNATFEIKARIGDELVLERPHDGKRELAKGANLNNEGKETLIWRPGRSSVRGVSVYDIEDREISKGDLIQWKRNQPELDQVKNGFDGKVLSVDGKVATVAFSDGNTRTIDLEKNPNWDHGYALTVYKAQGATYSKAMVVAPARPGPLLNQQTFYTALTRAQYAIELWTNDQGKLAKILTDNPGGKTSALEGVGEVSTEEPSKDTAPVETQDLARPSTAPSTEKEVNPWRALAQRVFRNGAMDLKRFLSIDEERATAGGAADQSVPSPAGEGASADKRRVDEKSTEEREGVGGKNDGKGSAPGPGESTVEKDTGREADFGR